MQTYGNTQLNEIVILWRESKLETAFSVISQFVLVSQKPVHFMMEIFKHAVNPNEKKGLYLVSSHAVNRTVQHRQGSNCSRLCSHTYTHKRTHRSGQHLCRLVAHHLLCSVQRRPAIGQNGCLSPQHCCVFIKYLQRNINTTRPLITHTYQ